MDLHHIPLRIAPYAAHNAAARRYNTFIICARCLLVKHNARRGGCEILYGAARTGYVILWSERRRLHDGAEKEGGRPLRRKRRACAAMSGRVRGRKALSGMGRVVLPARIQSGIRRAGRGLFPDPARARSRAVRLPACRPAPYKARHAPVRTCARPRAQLAGPGGTGLPRLRRRALLLCIRVGTELLCRAPGPTASACLCAATASRSCSRPRNTIWTRPTRLQKLWSAGRTGPLTTAGTPRSPDARRTRCAPLRGGIRFLKARTLRPRR